jgi:predicted nuclease with TOPRIM domain
VATLQSIQKIASKNFKENYQEVNEFLEEEIKNREAELMRCKERCKIVECDKWECDLEKWERDKVKALRE